MKLVDDKTFESEVLAEGLVLVDFYADWCGPCRLIGPFLEEIQSEIDIKIVKVNIDESPEIASTYGVMSIPTLIIFKEGKKISTNVGAASRARLVDWIKSNIS
ncbi:MAG: thioredoxin [Holosporaceae bacterium]|nr:thioredoxin [Holosporaceae bacterium]